MTPKKQPMLQLYYCITTHTILKRLEAGSGDAYAAKIKTKIDNPEHENGRLICRFEQRHGRGHHANTAQLRKTTLRGVDVIINSGYSHACRISRMGRRAHLVAYK